MTLFFCPCSLYEVTRLAPSPSGREGLKGRIKFNFTLALFRLWMFVYTDISHYQFSIYVRFGLYFSIYNFVTNECRLFKFCETCFNLEGGGGEWTRHRKRSVFCRFKLTHCLNHLLLHPWRFGEHIPWLKLNSPYVGTTNYVHHQNTTMLNRSVFFCRLLVDIFWNGLISVKSLSHWRSNYRDLLLQMTANSWITPKTHEKLKSSGYFVANDGISQL